MSDQPDCSPIVGRRNRLSLSESFQSNSLKNDSHLTRNKDSNLGFISEFRDNRRKHKSCYGAFPSFKFGPKATIVDNEETQLTLHDPRYQMLKWCKPPQSCLVIKKIWDTLADKEFIGLIIWLVQSKKFDVFVEKHVMRESSISSAVEWPDIKTKVFIYNQLDDNLSGKVDFVICAGGDGTLIYASSLFQGSMPPVMAFHLGSLGFLAPFNFAKYHVEIDNAIKGDEVGVMLRTRLSCMIRRNHVIPNNKNSSNAFIAPKNSKRILVLNEVVVDRGETPFLCHLDLYIDDIPVTVVQGDGLIISTPTGSTAYAAAAGASMVHPSVPAIIIAPICPHSLSFRPIIVPAGVEIKILIPLEARSNAWVSFDGRQRQQLAKQTDVLTIRTSEYPLPTICNRDPIFDWFNQLASCLHWNVRKIQSPIPASFSHTELNGLYDNDEQQQPQQ